MRIAVDAMGGDFAPEQVLQGASDAAAEYGIDISIVGLPGVVQPLLNRHPTLTLVPCTQVIGMDEHPAQAVRAKPDSSMSVCARLCKEGRADGWISAGNSGAIMATALFIQGRIRGVERPALGSVIPTRTGLAYFLDVGANVDSKPEYMVQFAAMGAVYAREMMGRTEPTIGLLSNGEEEGKGDERVRETTKRLKGTMKGFIGNVEPKDLYAAKADVIVADGFVGNVALKASEGIVAMLYEFLKAEFTRNLLTRLAAGIAYPVLRAVKHRIDPRRHNGATLVGLKGVVVKSHGSADVLAFKHALRKAHTEAAHGVLDNIAQRMAAISALTLPSATTPEASVSDV